MDKDTILGNLLEAYAKKYAECNNITVDEAKQSAMYKNYEVYCKNEYRNLEKCEV